MHIRCYYGSLCRLSGWWLSRPSGKYELVSWDGWIPNGKRKNALNHQPVMVEHIQSIPMDICKNISNRCSHGSLSTGIMGCSNIYSLTL